MKLISGYVQMNANAAASCLISSFPSGPILTNMSKSVVKKNARTIQSTSTRFSHKFETPSWLLTEESKDDEDEHQIGEDVHVVLLESEFDFEYHIDESHQGQD